MHVVMIANDTTYLYNFRREILNELQKQNHKITVVAQKADFVAELLDEGFLYEDIAFSRRGKNPLADLSLIIQFWKLFKRCKPDVVLTYNIKPNVYAGMVCRLLKIPYISNITGLGTAVEYPGIMQKLTCRLYKWGVAGAQCVFFQNRENEMFFRNRKMLHPKTHVRLLPGSGVNLQTHPVLQYPCTEQTHFLFVARILKEKGIDQYLAAAEAIRGKRQDMVFHVCGGCDDPLYKEVLAKAQEKGFIEYHGQQKDMQPYFQQAACIVHPSYYPEGMSNVLLEAAASGRPAIAADRSGCRETVDDGVSGYIVPIKDEQAVIEAIEKFLSLSWEERYQMGLAGRTKMEKEFDRKIVVNKYIEEVNAVGKQ